jgi:hypothetical protein
VPEACERAHDEIRRASTDLQKTITGMEKDVSSLRRILEALTNAIRDGAISFAGHDKAQSDLKSHFVGELEAIRDRLTDLDGDLQSLHRLQDEAKDAHEDFAEVGEAIFKNRELLLELLGMAQSLNPPPLARDLKEMLRLLREVTDRDPATGEPLAGWALFWPKVRAAFLTALAVAGLTVAYKVLTPYLFQAK